MHAGHTPNHSISKFPFLGSDGSESGNATPTQENHGQGQDRKHEQRRSSFAPEYEHQPDPRREERQDQNQGHEENHDQGDKELSGPLGFTNDISKDDAFLAQLVEKLEEARRSTDASPSTESSSSRQSQNRSLSPRKRELAEEDTEDDDKDEGPPLRLSRPSFNFGPPLRLRPSFNFGRPMGSM
jgi:hypothetical protein